MKRPVSCRIATIILVILPLLLAACTANPDSPNTPAFRQLNNLITALNSGSYETVREFASANLSEDFIAGQLDERVDSLMLIHNMSEQLIFERVLNSSRYQVIAEVHNHLADMNTVLGVSVERNQPNRITMCYKGPVYLYEQWEANPVLGQDQVIKSMQSTLTRLSSNNVFSGVVLIGKEESILWQGAFGLAHHNPDILNDINTRFNIASVGKLFTTVSIAQLAEKGLLAYEDPVSKYLDSDWLPKDIASEITIEHLLTHRSGLGDFLESEELLQADSPPILLDAYKPVISEDQPAFTPGSQFQYSNSGYILLGAIIEEITDQTFGNYVQTNVLQPAGISSTYEVPLSTEYLPAPHYATGYTTIFSSSGRSWIDNTERLQSVAPSPAGGQYLNAEDLWRLANAIRNGKLINKQTWQLLSTPASKGGSIGYGLEVHDYGENHVVGHGGSLDGIGAVLDIYLYADYTLVILSNTDRSAFMLREKFATLVLK